MPPKRKGRKEPPRAHSLQEIRAVEDGEPVAIRRRTRGPRDPSDQATTASASTSDGSTSYPMTSSATPSSAAISSVPSAEVDTLAATISQAVVRESQSFS